MTTRDNTAKEVEISPLQYYKNYSYCEILYAVQIIETHFYIPFSSHLVPNRPLQLSLSLTLQFESEVDSSVCTVQADAQSSSIDPSISLV